MHHFGWEVCQVYHIVICDDDKRFIDYIKDVILQSGIEQDEVLFYEYLSGNDLIGGLDRQKVCDLLVLDIQMKGMDGNETAVKFREKFPIATLVFCSGVCHPTDESFKVTPFRFLFKSYSRVKMIREMHAIVKEIRLKKAGPQIIGTYYYNTICLRPEDILYIENSRTGSIFHVRKDIIECAPGKHIKTAQKIKDLFEELQTYGFERAHNSYIVNLNYVIKLQSNGEITLRDNTILMVARSKLKHFRKAFSEWVSKKY